MDRTVDHPTIPAAQGPVVWLLSTRDARGATVAPDAELLLTEAVVRAFTEHLAGLSTLGIDLYERLGALSLLSVCSQTGHTMNLSRVWDGAELERAQLRADLADALTGPVSVEPVVPEDEDPAARELDAARTEVLELRAALADANARDVFLHGTIAELRAAQTALPAPALTLALTA